MPIADRIRKERIARGLTVRALGKVVGVSGSAVSQWEAGGTIKPANQAALSDALGIPITEFLPFSANNRDLVVSDAQEKVLVERFRQLPATLREAYLRMLIAQADSSGT